jgi:uncharacterized membrane protein
LGQSASSPTNDDEEIRRTAAAGYLVWPLAIADIVREPENATIWSRLHARQALVYGVLGTLAYGLLLALPLIAVMAFSGIDTGTTVLLYGIGLVLDVVAGVFFLWLTARYYQRTVRGELFRIPIVTPIADRFFRLERE